MSEHGWVHAIPILRVTSLRASIEHYVTVLGFTVRWELPGFAAVSRGDCTLFLCEGDQTPPHAWVWIGAPDVEALHEELRARGAIIRHPPTNYPWAVEMQVADPDGNVLRVGMEPREGEPFGEWLDASGKRWTAEGQPIED